MKSDQELRQLAADVIAGKVFGSWNLPPEHAALYAPEVFVQLKMVAGDRPPQDLGALYEYTDKRTPASDAQYGHPVFLTFQALTMEEVRRFTVFVHQGEVDQAAMLAGVIVPGVCVHCGWVEGQGAGAWADKTRTLCKTCSLEPRQARR